MARFKPGQSGNPSGRPLGARNKLSEVLLQDLAADFEEHGRATIVRVREDDPAVYLRVIAALVPKQLEINPSDPFEGLSDDEIGDLIALVRKHMDGSPLEH